MAIVAVLASVAVVAVAAGASRLLTTHNAAAAGPALNMNCTLIVPADPLSAQGLATPYQLTATDPADGPCNEANSNQTAFVQGAVIDPATGRISVYDPLVVDLGTQPAAAPVVPTLPAGGVVAVWFGFNGNTLSLAGPDQVPPAASASATPASTSTSTQSAAPSATASPGTASPATAQSSTATSPTTPSSTTASPSAPATQASPATPTASGSPASASAPAASSAPAATGQAAVSRAATQAEAAAPLPPGSSEQAGFSGSLTKIGQGGAGAGHGGQKAPASPAASPSQTPSPSASASASMPTSTSTSASAGPSASASMGTASVMPAPPVTAGDTPAASATPDAVLLAANCVAGEAIGGQFSSFTQVGACNATAFFAAANAAIRAGKLRVPSPGVGADGMKCMTTRSFALIDQDQSDNVTTEYLSQPDGQTAQDTAANRQAIAGAATLFNGSDNGLLDLFVDPALGCLPWEAPNLADGGAPAPALPLDELQAARWAGTRGNPAALVPLNDPMTLDNNGQFSTDKTNTYRALVDMPALPAGESPRQYCSDMERIQGGRLQQDVNLLTANPGPLPAAADNLFTFMAMRLQQSFMNLNCASFGMSNDVSTTVDGNGVVVAACFLRQAAPVTAGPGNPMAGVRTCPATTATASAPASSPAATMSPSATGSPSATSSAAGSTPSSTTSPSPWGRHHRNHWWW